MRTTSLSCIQSVEYNKEKHPILNQILVDLQKQITFYKVLAHIEVKGNEEADKAVKQAIDMPGVTITRLSYTGYYLIIRRARIFQ